MSPEETVAVEAPNESAQPQETPSAPEAPQERGSLRDSLSRAFDTVEKGDTSETPVSSPPQTSEAKPERARGPDGKFVAQQQPSEAATATAEAEVKPAAPAEQQPAATADTFAEPPTRFSPDAKAAWRDAPLAIRAEVHRAVREMQGGIDKYREAAEAFEPLRPYADLARQHGVSIQSTLDQYINVSRALQSQNPLPAIEHVLNLAGLSPRDYAAAVMGQKPDQAQSQQEAVIRNLRNELASLKQEMQREVGEVRSTFQQQRMTSVAGQVEEFAKTHPRFEELAQEVAQQLKLGYTLDQAYERADRLNPAPAAAKAPEAASSAAPSAPPAHTQKGTLQVTGAPSPGSDPRNRKPPSSARDALARRFDELGVA